jgi:hypothetical protein
MVGEVGHVASDRGLSAEIHLKPSQLLPEHVLGDGHLTSKPARASDGATPNPDPSPIQGEGGVFVAPHPTLPSRLMATSFCASTANSIGSCCRTSLTKPFTRSCTASSWLRPRCMA